MEQQGTASRRLAILICLLIVLATAFAFWQVKENGFLVFDDDAYIAANPFVRNGLSLESLKWAFTAVHASNWHPLTWLSHMLDCQLFGLDPGRHHLVNLLFHLLNTALLFWVLRGFTGSLWASAFVAALFALHPLHVESVAWASERKDVLSTLFWLLTMGAYLFYVRSPGPARYGLVFLSLALGLMAKPMLVTLPLVLLLLDYWPLGRIEDGAGGVRRRGPGRLVREKAPLFALSAASCAVTLYAQKAGGAVRPVRVFSVGARLENAAVSYAAYLKKMVWPAKLAIFYPLEPSIPLGKVLASVALLLAVTLLVIFLRRRMPFLLAGWLWYVITLLPVIGLVKVGAQAMADRYTYVPLIGPFIMVAWTAARASKKGRGPRTVLAVSGVAALVALAGLTRHQVALWKDSVTLFSHAARVTENNYLAHNNLAAAFIRLGRIDRAEASARKALAIHPGCAQAWNNLGVATHLKGGPQKAVGYYRRALKISRDYAAAHYNLGLSLADLGRLEEAAARYRKAAKLDPAGIRPLINLGVTLEKLGRRAEAIEAYTGAVEIDPNNAQAHNNLGVALAKGGEPEKAFRHFSRALKIDPEFQFAHNNWGNALMMAKRVEDALVHYRRALEIAPRYPEAQNNLGVALMRLGRLEEALARFEEALDLAPGYADARRNKELVLDLMREPPSEPAP